MNIMAGRKNKTNEGIYDQAHIISITQCFDTVGWVTGRASGP